MVKTKKSVCLLLMLAILIGMLVMPAAATDQSVRFDDNVFLKMVSLDAGRKYFSVSEIEGIIDDMAANGYDALELGLGNDGMRFVLDDMSVTVGNVTYSSDSVKTAILTGNSNYYNDPNGNALTETEMDEIIAYATEKGISIIPLVNSPGHMDAILDTIQTLADSSAAYSGSGRTIDVTNSTAVAFTQTLLTKYIAYFAGKGCAAFNMGCDEYANDTTNGFSALISAGTYGSFISYVNSVAAIIKDYGMVPMAFNDGIYYNSTTRYGTFDSDIAIAYWSNGWSGYYPASSAFLAGKGHQIINVNSNWYYVIGSHGSNSGWATYEHAAKDTVSVKVTTTVDSNTSLTLSGSMLAIWCDTPSNTYKASDVTALLQNQANANTDYFTAKPAVKEVYLMVGDTAEYTLQTAGMITTKGDSSIASAVVTNGTTITFTGNREGITEYIIGGGLYRITVCPAACTHAHTELRDAYAATCTTDGYTGDIYCTDCGDLIAAGELIAATGHSYDEGVVTTEPTMDAEGVRTYTCTSCGATKTEKIDKLPEDGSLRIITQPEGGEATIGQTVTISFEAVNAAGCQWYYSKDDGTTWKKLYWTGCDTDTLTFAYTAARSAYRYRCEVTGTDGTTLYTQQTSITRGVAPDGVITDQPDSVFASVGDTVYFHITAENAVSYQWYYSSDNGSSWSKLYWEGAQTDTLTVEASSARFDYIYHCKIADGNGKTISSSRCYLRQYFSLIEQPQNAAADYGENVALTVSAVGVKSYQWYYSKDDGASWSKLYWTGYKTGTLTVAFNASRESYRYRCELVGYDDARLTTDAVKITKSDAPAAITVQPENVTAAAGSTTTLSLTAEHAASYRWYYSKDGGTTWIRLWWTGYNTDTLTVSVTEARMAYLYHCVVTGNDGAAVISDSVSIQKTA